MMSILEDFKGHFSLLRRECRNADKTCLLVGFTFFVAGCFLGGTCLMYGAIWIFTLLYFLIGISGFALCCFYAFTIFSDKTSEVLPLLSRKNKREKSKKVSKRKFTKKFNFNSDRKEKAMDCNFSRTDNYSDLGNILVLKKHEKSAAKDKVSGSCIKLNLNRHGSKCNEQYITSATYRSDCSDEKQEGKERSRNETINSVRKLINFPSRIILHHSTSETENPPQQVEIHLEQFPESESKNTAFFHEKPEVSQDAVDCLGQDFETNMRDEAKLLETTLFLDRTYETSPVKWENPKLLDSADYLQRDFGRNMRENAGKWNKSSKTSSISEKYLENLQTSCAQNSKFSETQNINIEIRQANQSNTERLRTPVFSRIASYHDPLNRGENRERSLANPLNLPMKVQRTSSENVFSNAKLQGLNKIYNHNENFSEVREQNNAPSYNLKSNLNAPAGQIMSVSDDIIPFTHPGPILENHEDFLVKNVISEILSDVHPETFSESSKRHNQSPEKFGRANQKEKDNVREISFKSPFYNMTSSQRHQKQCLQFKNTFGHDEHSSAKPFRVLDTENHDKIESLDISSEMSGEFKNIQSNEDEIETFNLCRPYANTIPFYEENEQAALSSAAARSEHGILPRPQKMSRKRILDKLWEESRNLQAQNLYKNEKVDTEELETEEMETMPLLYKKTYYNVPPVLERLLPNPSETSEPTMSSESDTGSTIMEEEVSSNRSPKERELMFRHYSGYNNFLYFAELDEWDPDIFPRTELLSCDAPVPDEVPHLTSELGRESYDNSFNSYKMDASEDEFSALSE